MQIPHLRVRTHHSYHSYQDLQKKANYMRIFMYINSESDLITEIREKNKTIKILSQVN